MIVSEGTRYTVGDVRIAGAKVFDAKKLRPLIPLEPGELFDVSKVREGIAALHDFYKQHGYIYATPVPDTQINEDSASVVLTLNMDEGSQFKVEKVEIAAPPDLLKSLSYPWPLKSGDVFNVTLVERFFTENSAQLPPGAAPDKDVDITEDRKAGTVRLRGAVPERGRAGKLQLASFAARDSWQGHSEGQPTSSVGSRR